MFFNANNCRIQICKKKEFYYCMCKKCSGKISCIVDNETTNSETLDVPFYGNKGQ